MNFAAVLLAPLVLMLPGAFQPVQEEVWDDTVKLGRPGQNASTGVAAFDSWPESYRVPGAAQVRIEQHTTIRVAPRPLPLRPSMLTPPRRTPTSRRVVERRVGRCIPATRIAGVEVEMGKRLILYLRDQRVIRAELERSCRAQDFYSGFYLSNNPDGRLCVDRDTLLSRSGANCKLTRIRQLVFDDD